MTTQKSRTKKKALRKGRRTTLLWTIAIASIVLLLAAIAAARLANHTSRIDSDTMTLMIAEIDKLDLPSYSSSYKDDDGCRMALGQEYCGRSLSYFYRHPLEIKGSEQAIYASLGANGWEKVVDERHTTPHDYPVTYLKKLDGNRLCFSLTRGLSVPDLDTYGNTEYDYDAISISANEDYGCKGDWRLFKDK